VCNEYFLVDGKLDFNIFEPSNCFCCLIFFLTRGNASWYNCETLMIVIFKKSLELSFYSSREGFGLSQKEESRGTGELDEVIERIFASLTFCYVLFDCIEHNIRALFSFMCAHGSKLFIDEIVRKQIDFWSRIKSILS